MLIAAQSGYHGPKETVGLVSKGVGGIVNARCASQLPHNERQVPYIRGRGKRSASSVHVSNKGDEMLQMMQQAKFGDSTGLFVRDIRSSPEPAFVLARNCQLDDLERFCTNPSAFSMTQHSI